MRLTLLMLLLAAAGARTLPAQATTDSIAVGMRVRAHDESGGTYEGRLASTADGVLEIASERSRVRLPVGQVMRLEVSRGRDAGHGMRFGALVGGTVGVLGGIVFLLDDSRTCDYDFTGALACEKTPKLRNFATSVAAGAGVGLFLGRMLGHERWEEVGVPRTRLSLHVTPWVAPRGGGVAIALR